MKNYLRTVVFLIVFIIFVAAAIIVYTSADFIRARDELAYLHSDKGKFSMQVEEDINELTGQNNDSAYRQWHKKVERAEEIVENKQTLCLILGGFSLLSLGGVAVMFIQDRKNIVKQESLK